MSLLLQDILEYHYHTQYNNNTNIQSTDNTNIQSTDILWSAKMPHFYETQHPTSFIVLKNGTIS